MLQEVAERQYHKCEARIFGRNEASPALHRIAVSASPRRGVYTIACSSPADII
ncbi:hypothetical protein [Streptomyces sp. NPDC001675]